MPESTGTAERSWRERGCYVVSHGYGITVGCGTTIDVEPVHEMEKVLFAADQLGWELEKLLTMTLEAMKASEDLINAECAE